MSFQTITPSDTVALSIPIRAIWCGVSGDVALRAKGDASTVLLKAVPGNTWVSVAGAGNGSVDLIAASLTTATSIIGAT